MPRTLPTLACSLVAAIVSTSVVAQTPLNDQDASAIRASVLLLVDRTNNEPMATLTQYVANDRVTSVNSEKIVTGWEALVVQTRQSQAGAFNMQAGNLDIVGMGSDHALVVAPFTMFYSVSGSLVSVPGSMTLAYERTPQGWKIIHEHYSAGLDEQTRVRISRAASGIGGITPGDLVRLFLVSALGTPAQLLRTATDMLAPRSCSR